MTDSRPAPDDSGETYQEGVSPVQSFTTTAIPVGPHTVLEPRRGRPARKRVEPISNPPPANGEQSGDS